MNEGLDIEMVKEHYSKISDNELVYLASQNASGLTEAAQEAIKEEMVKRGFNDRLLEAVDAQNKIYTEEELKIYIAIVEDLNCPYCSSHEAKLNGINTVLIASFFLSLIRRRLHIGCPNCISGEASKALWVTMLMGWWGHGIFYTIPAIISNIKSIKELGYEEHTQAFEDFVLKNIGVIELHKEDRPQLQQWLKTAMIGE